jgi:hypothetical protein
MSKRTKSETSIDELLSHYDFRAGVRGKHHRDYQRGHRVTIHKTDGTTVVQNFKLEEGAVVLAQDVREFFPDSESVNRALRALIGLIPRKRGRPASK